MSRLTEQKKKMGKPVDADPLPETKVQGDSSETEIVDHNDAPPGVDPKAAQNGE